jgi:agmatinase
VDQIFFDVGEKYSNYSDSKIVILRAPYERSASYISGTSFAPSSILEASTQVELYDAETGKEPYKHGIHTAPVIDFDNMSEDPTSCLKKIEDAVKKVISDGKFPVLIGGEHTVTLGAYRAFEKDYEKMSLISLDAHGDMRESFHDDIYSHACVMRLISKIGDLSVLGVRSLAKEEKDYFDKMEIPLILACELKKDKTLLDKVLDRSKELIYLSIDMDVLDPSLVPGVGTPEPGGFDWNEILYIIRKIVKSKRIVGIDVVELSPIKGQIASDYIAAKLIYRILAYIFK